MKRPIQNSGIQSARIHSSGVAQHSIVGLLLACVLFPLPSTSEEPTELLMFSTDGCSAFPDGHISNQRLWQDCCIAHDLAYWAGGSYDDRVAADEALAECVADVGEPAIAKLMLAGVRAGGSPFFPTTFRWGYGWRYVRGYSPLSDAEKALILDTIDRAPAEAFTPVTVYQYLAPLPRAPQPSRQ